MSDENYSLIIQEWLALNPKVYSFKYQDNIDNNNIENKRICKGVSKATVKTNITHDDYLKCF
jgi:hypothetical protein